MPYAQCPRCRLMHYFKVDDVAVWYTDHFPNHKPGYVVPILCAECAKDEVHARHVRVKESRQ
jgi:hypothetical protein